MASVELQGLADLEQALTDLDLSRPTWRNVLLRSAEQALQPMADKADELAPDNPRTTKRKIKGNIAVSPRRKAATATQYTPEKPSTVTVYMGPTKEAYPEAMLEEFGARPHVIAPRRKARLKFFEGDGSFKQPLVVHHPGSKPVAYMRRAFETLAQETVHSVGGILSAEIQKAADRAERKAARQAAKIKGL